MRTYEGMFLLDAGQAATDWDATVGVVTGVLERYGAEMALHGKFDERKLAYPIKKHKRGAYYLAYFNAPTDSIMKIREDLGLREEVLRFLILARPEDLPIPETLEITPMVDDEEDDRRGGGGGGGRGRRRDDRGGGGGGGGFGGGRRPRSDSDSGDAAPADDSEGGNG